MRRFLLLLSHFSLIFSVCQDACRCTDLNEGWNETAEVRSRVKNFYRGGGCDQYLSCAGSDYIYVQGIYSEFFGAGMDLGNVPFPANTVSDDYVRIEATQSPGSNDSEVDLVKTLGIECRFPFWKVTKFPFGIMYNTTDGQTLRLEASELAGKGYYMSLVTFTCRSYFY